MSALSNTSASKRSQQLVRALLVTTALVSFGGVAHAKDKVAKETATAAAADAAAGQVGEVVVTARRRSEDLQSVPISVTALSGDAIDQLNIRNFQDLRGAVPNLEVLPLATGGANLTIRGIGQGSSQVNTDAKAGFYMDEVYIARQEGNQLYFYDIDSVQVLKGPQAPCSARTPPPAPSWSPRPVPAPTAAATCRCVPAPFAASTPRARSMCRSPTSC